MKYTTIILFLIISLHLYSQSESECRSIITGFCQEAKKFVKAYEESTDSNGKTNFDLKESKEKAYGFSNEKFDKLYNQSDGCVAKFPQLSNYFAECYCGKLNNENSSSSNNVSNYLNSKMNENNNDVKGAKTSITPFSSPSTLGLEPEPFDNEFSQSNQYGIKLYEKFKIGISYDAEFQEYENSLTWSVSINLHNNSEKTVKLGDAVNIRTPDGQIVTIEPKVMESGFHEVINTTVSLPKKQKFRISPVNCRIELDPEESKNDKEESVADVKSDHPINFFEKYLEDEEKVRKVAIQRFEESQNKKDKAKPFQTITNDNPTEELTDYGSKKINEQDLNNPVLKTENTSLYDQIKEAGIAFIAKTPVYGVKKALSNLDEFVDKGFLGQIDSDIKVTDDQIEMGSEEKLENNMKKYKDNVIVGGEDYK
jgi:hypothetical protein